MATGHLSPSSHRTCSTHPLGAHQHPLSMNIDPIAYIQQEACSFYCLLRFQTLVSQDRVQLILQQYRIARHTQRILVRKEEEQCRTRHG
jgi:hypothetical protein